MSLNRQFYAGLASGVALTVVVLAVAVGAIILRTKATMEQRWDREEEEVRQRTRPLLPEPDLPDAEDPPAYGRVHYDWSLVSLEGEKLTFDRFRGRVLFIDYWATWCVPCVAEFPGLRTLQEDLEGMDRISMLLITDEDAEPVRTFLDERDQTDLPVYLARQGVPSPIHATTRPAAFVVDCDGTVSLRHAGGAEWNTEEFRRFLEARVRASC